MPVKPEKPSRAAHALAQILDEGGALALSLKEQFHWTLLWRYRTGRRKPGLKSAQRLSKLTRGKVKESAWHEPVSK